MRTIRPLRFIPFLLSTTALTVSPSALANVATPSLEQSGNSMYYESQFRLALGRYDAARTYARKTNSAQLPEQVEALVRFSGTCEAGHKLSRSELRILPAAGLSHKHSWPKQDNYGQATVAIGSNSTLKYVAAELCNTALPSQPADAMGNVAAFTLYNQNIHRAEHTLWCGSNQSAKVTIDLGHNVLCGPAKKKLPPTAASTLAAEFAAARAVASISPNVRTASCPVEMNLSMQVETTGAGLVSFIVETDQGKTSQPFRVRSKRVGAKYLAVVNRPFSVPAVSGSGHSELGFSNPSSAPSRGLSARPGGSEPISNGGLSANPTPAGLQQGSFRIRVQAPNELVSNWASYRVQCQAGQAPSGFSAGSQPMPGGLQPQPELQGFSSKSGPRSNATGLPTGKRQHKPLSK